MSGERVDVLGVLGELLAFASRGVESDDPARQMIEAAIVASEAVAELIEADKAYDDAQFGLARARYNSAPLGMWANNCAQADIRRSAALSRIQPDGQGE